MAPAKLSQDDSAGVFNLAVRKFLMHVPKTLREAIASGFCATRLTEAHDKMAAVMRNFLKRKFGKAILSAEDKPLGPEELNALLTEILSGNE